MSESANVASAGNIIAEVIDDGRISGQQVLVVGLCMFLNVLDGFDITAMSIVASDVSRELQIGADKLGLIFSVALAGMMVGAMFLAPVSDVVGRRKVIIGSVALVGVSVLFSANVTTYSQLLFLRFTSGLGAGAMLVCQAALAAEYSPEKYRSLSVALTTAGFPLGAMMTSVLAGTILPGYGWRGMFLFGGAVTILTAIVTMRLLPESLKYLLERQPVNALQRANKILVKLKKDTLQALPLVTRPTTRRGDGLTGNMFNLLSPGYRTVTLTLWTTSFLGFGTLYFLMSWIPKLMEQAGFPVDTGRFAFFLFNLGGVAGIFLLGILSTRLILTNLVAVFLSSSGILMAVFATVTDHLSLLLVLIGGVGVFLIGGFTGLYAVAAKAYPTAIRSTGIGWVMGLGRSGAVFGPAVAGYLIASGLSMSANFYVFAVPMVIGGIVAYLLKVS